MNKKNILLRTGYYGKILLMAGMIACMILSTPACKSSKKATKAKAENEARLAKEREEEEKKKEVERKQKEEAEAREKAKKEPYTKLDNYFQQIAGAQNVNDANKAIDEAVKLCNSGDTPLLIIISKSGNEIDYDKPSTIKKYSEYLKDQKNNPNKIERLDMDANGKINKIVLTKK